MIGTDMRSAFKPVDAIVLSGVSPGCIFQPIVTGHFNRT